MINIKGLILTLILFISLIPPWALGEGSKDTKVFADYYLAGDSVVINATLYDAGSCNLTFSVFSPIEAPNVSEISFTWMNLSEYIESATEATYGEYLRDGNVIMREDDGYFIYELPFSLNYFGREIKKIAVNTNGLIELLEEYEEPRIEDYYGIHEEGEFYESDVIFGLDEDLVTYDGYLLLVNLQDKIVIEWLASTYEDYESEIVDNINFQVIINSNGTITWSYKSLEYSYHDYDLFSGYYSKVSGDVKGFTKGEGKSFAIQVPLGTPKLYTYQVRESGSYLLTLPLSNYHVEVFANCMDDPDLSNNLAEVGVWPGDYWVENASINNLIPGEFASINFKVRTTSKIPSAKVKLLRNGVEEKIEYLSFYNGIAEGEISWLVQGGNYTLALLVEGKGDINSSNNIYLLGNYNFPLPNFEVGNYSIDLPTCVDSTGEVRVNVTSTANWSIPVRLTLVYEEGNRSYTRYISTKGEEESEVIFTPMIKAGTLEKVVIEIDPWNEVEESNESDNKVEVPYHIIIEKPDFTVKSLNIPGNVSIGNLYEVNVTLDNLGGCYGRNVLVKLYENGTSKDWRRVRINNETNVTLTWKPGNAGLVNLTVVVDPYSYVDEINEGNNRLSRLIFVNAPDFKISKVELLSFDGIAGSKAKFNVTVKNEGEDYSGYFSIAVYGGLRSSIAYLRGIKSGEEKWTIISLPINGGNSTLIFVVDPHNVISETNEGNNVIFYNMGYIPKPNFVVKEISLPNNTVGYIPLNITIGNVGAPYNATSYQVPVKIKTEYGWKVSYLRGIIRDNYTISIDSLAMLPPGSTINVTVNYNMKVNETSYSDNSLIINYTTGYPDLELGIIPPSGELSAGKDVKITFLVKNVGNATLRIDRSSWYSPYLGLYVTLEDENGKTHTLGRYELAPATLSPGANISQVVWITLNGGTNKIMGRIVDEYENIYENNNDTLILTLEKPDFAILNYSIPDEILNGTAYLYKAYPIVLNISNLGGNFSDGIRVDLFDNGIIKTSTSVYGLESGASRDVTLRYLPSSGKHNLSIVLDPYNRWIEENEENNNLTFSLSFGKPDLKVEGITWAPYNFTSGENVLFTIYVKNLGQPFLKSFTVRAEIWNGTRKIYSTNAYPRNWSFGKGETKEFNWRWYNAKPGNLTVKIVVDYYNSIPEGNESNNEFSAFLGNVGTPDFKLENLSVEDLAYGKFVRINATVKNLGDSIYRPITVLFNVSGERYYRTVYGIKENESKSVTLPWYVDRVGEVRVKVEVDPGNRIVEGNESNNIIERTYYVESPELMLSGYEWLEEEVRRGYLAYKVNVTNTGGDVYRGFYVQMFVDGEPKSSVWINKLLHGETAERTLRWRFSSGGRKEVRIVVDPQDYIPESNEDNNAIVENVTIVLPDIEVLSLNIPSMHANSYFKVNATIKNSGGQDVKRIFYVSLYQDGKLLGSAPVYSLASGEVKEVTLTIRPYPGNSTFKVVVDPTNAVVELNEDNNEISVRSYVKAPDIVVVSADLGNFTYPGEMVNAKVRIRNSGDYKSGVYLLIRNKRRKLGSAYVDSITPGEEIEVNVPWLVDSGDYNVSVIADPYNSVREWDEENNKLDIEVSVPSPDLTVENITHSGKEVAGEEIIIKVTVKNIGESSKLPFYIVLYANSSFVGINRVTKIDKGESITLEFKWRASYGEYALRAIVDPYDEVYEENESNNEGMVKVFIEDEEPPVLKLTYPENGTFTNKPYIGAYLRDEGSGVKFGEIEVYREGTSVPGSTKFSGGWLIFQNSTPLLDGKYTVTVKAVDRAGNEITYSWNFTLDREPPRIVCNLTDGTLYNGTVVPGVQVIDDNLDWYKVKVNGREFSGPIKLDGTYTLNVTAKDKAGNLAEKIIRFTVNGVPSPPSGVTLMLNGSYVELSWLPSPDSDVAGYFIYKDGKRLNEVPIEKPNFRDIYSGTLNYSISAIDFSGFESEKTEVFPVKLEVDEENLTAGYPGAVKVKVENLDGEANGTLSIILIDEFGNEIEKLSRKVEVPRGRSSHEFVFMVPRGLTLIRGELKVGNSTARIIHRAKVREGENPEIRVGKLLAGFPGLVEVEIRNCGIVELNTSETLMKLDNSSGELIEAPLTIPPGKKTVLRYKIVPPKKGSYNLTFRIADVEVRKIVNVSESVLNPITISTENFIKGGKAKIYVSFRNIGSAPIFVKSIELNGMSKRLSIELPPNLSVEESFEYLISEENVEINATVNTDVGKFRKSLTLTAEQPEYNADVSVSSVYEVGKEILITGVAYNESGMLSNVPVKVSIARGGFVREYIVTTNENGYFNLTFRPFKGESGHFIVSATHPKIELLERDAEFDVVGIEVIPSLYLLTVPVEFNGTVRVRLINYWRASDVSVSVKAPPEYEVSIPKVLHLKPGSNIINIGLSSKNAVNGSIMITFKARQLGLNITRSLTLKLKVLPPAPAIVTSPNFLDVGVLTNETASAEVVVRNLGFTALRNVSIRSSIPWVKVVSNFTEVDPKDNESISLYIEPPRNVTGTFKGEITISSSNYNPIKVPMRIRVTPNATGGVKVTVMDPNATRLENVKLTLYNGYFHFEGYTNKNGTLEVENVPIGEYKLFASLEGYYGYSTSITIEVGVEKNVSIILTPSILEVEWEVVPVTIQDVYIIKHEMWYSTHVPAPEIRMEGGDLEVYVDYEKLAEEGMLEFRGQVIVRNTHQYISVYNVTFESGGSHYIDVEFGINRIDELKPGEAVIVPYVVRIYYSRSPPINPCLHETKVFKLKAGVVCVEEAGKITLKAQRIHQIVVKPTCKGCWESVFPVAGKLAFMAIAQKVGQALGNIDDTGVLSTLAGEALNNLESLFDAYNAYKANPTKENMENYVKTFNSVKANLASLFMFDPVAYQEINSLQLTLIKTPKGDIAGFAVSRTATPVYALGMGVGKIENGQLKVDYKKAVNIANGIVLNVMSKMGGALGGIASGVGLLQLLDKAAEDLPPYIAQLFLNCAICLMRNDCTLPEGEEIRPIQIIASGSLGGYPSMIPSGLAGGGDGGTAVGRFTCGGLPTVKKSSTSMSCSTCSSEDVVKERVCRLFRESETHDEEEPSNTLHMCVDLVLTIEQRLTFERQAFRASLKFTNTNRNYSLENVSVRVIFFDEEGNRVDDKFFVRLDEKAGLSGSSLEPEKTAEMKWLIIPKVGAAEKFRARYYVMANITARVGSTKLVYETWPAMIEVEPVPQLVLDYVLPSYVFGDDPYTPEKELPIPFIFGVRVKNVGYGTARKLRIASAQPKIERSNYPGVYIDFKIIGTLVNGKKVPNSLTIDFGDLNPGESSTAAWLMIAEVSGKFLQYNATFKHSDELGGNETSLIKEVRTHFLIRAFNNTENDDGMLDFLVDDDGDGKPEKIIDSRGFDYNVLLLNFTEVEEGSMRKIIPEMKTPFWVYFTVPFKGSVVRSDGKNPMDQWMENGTLHVLDLGTPEFYILKSNQPPIPRIYVKEPVIANETVVLDGSLSYDPDGSIIAYTWKIGNESFVGDKVSYVFREPGTYNVTLTVRDDKGTESSKTMEIKVYLGPKFNESLKVEPQWGIVPFNLSITFNVTNVGDVSGEYSYIIKLGNSTIAEGSEIIESGRWKVINSTVEIRKEGNYTVTANNLSKTVTAYRKVYGNLTENYIKEKDFGHYKSFYWNEFKRDFEGWVEEALSTIELPKVNFKVLNYFPGNWSLLNYSEMLNITKGWGWINATYARRVRVEGLEEFKYLIVNVTQLVVLLGNATHELDESPPTLNVTPSSGIYSEIPKIQVRTCDETGITLVWGAVGNYTKEFTEVESNGTCSTWEGIVPLNIGNNTVAIYAEDEFGNRGNVSLWIYLNPEAPVIYIESPEEKVYNSREVMINYTVVNHDLVGVVAYLNGELISSNASYSGFIKLDYGWHNFTIYAWDVSYNVSKSVIFRVNEPPSVDFSWEVDNLTVKFEANASDEDGISKYLWDFGDNESSLLVNPTHTYRKGGRYNVTLTVWDSYNLSSSISKEVVVFGSSTLTMVKEYSYTKDFGFYNTTSWKDFLKDFEVWVNLTLRNVTLPLEYFEEIIEVNVENWSLISVEKNLKNDIGEMSAEYERNATIVGIMNYTRVTLKLTQEVILSGRARKVEDKIPPLVEILFPRNMTYNETIREIKVRATDESGIANVTATINGESLSLEKVNETWIGRVELDDGKYELNVFASDKWGNVGCSTVNFTINRSVKVRIINGTEIVTIPGDIKTRVYFEGDIIVEIVKESLRFKIPSGGTLVIDERGRKDPWLLARINSTIENISKTSRIFEENGKKVHEIRYRISISRGYAILVVPLEGMKVSSIRIIKNGTVTRDEKHGNYYKLSKGYLFIFLSEDPIVEVTLSKIEKKDIFRVLYYAGIIWERNYLRLKEEFIMKMSNETSQEAIRLHEEAEKYYLKGREYYPRIPSPSAIYWYAVYMRKAYLTERKALELLSIS